MSRVRAFRKQVPAGAARYPAWEAAGLRWLADASAAGGADVVEVLEVGPSHLDLRRLDPSPATSGHARALGRGLARTHAAGAPAYGSGPPGWVGHGWLGPTSEPLPLVLGSWTSWGPFLAEARILPLVREGRDRGVLDVGEVAALERLASVAASGALDTGDPPARLHGDLWSGNVVWTASGAVLVDPAAHGGHREADLAMLALFGCPHLDDVVAGYEEVGPLADGWRERVGLHQVHPLLLHAVLFGGSYASRAVAAARATT
ncbi:fructosamine kinase family protein [Oryzobacter terrae]|uniref:fructosamine kinase family protein n=1 Tax=Oryzobacter terrae TaxID=1620385 RepID=UPI00366BFA09